MGNELPSRGGVGVACVCYDDLYERENLSLGAHRKKTLGLNERMYATGLFLAEKKHFPETK
jgi:hypothetical protein